MALEARPADQVVAHAAEDERGPPVVAVGHAAPPGPAMAGRPIVLVALKAATVVRLTWSLSAATRLAGAYRAGVPAVAVTVASAYGAVGVVAVPGIEYATTNWKVPLLPATVCAGTLQEAAGTTEHSGVVPSGTPSPLASA